MASTIFEHLTYHAPYVNLVYKAQVGLDTGLCLGVTDTGSPYLFRVLSKATGFVSPNTVSQLMLNNNNITPQYTWDDYIYRNRTFVFIIIVLVIIILFLILWHKRQKRYNREIRRAVAARTAFFNNLSHDKSSSLKHPL